MTAKEYRERLRARWEAVAIKPQDAKQWAMAEVANDKEMLRQQRIKEAEERAEITRQILAEREEIRRKASLALQEQRRSELLQQKRLADEKEARESKWWNRLLEGETVRLKNGDGCIFDSYRIQGKFVYIRLKKGEQITNEYWFPDAFEKGILSFEKD